MWVDACVLRAGMGWALDRPALDGSSTGQVRQGVRFDKTHCIGVVGHGMAIVERVALLVVFVSGLAIRADGC